MQFEIRTSAEIQQKLADFCLFLTKNSLSQACVFDCRLVASELVGNVFKHAQGGAILAVQVQGCYVELIVYSSAPFLSNGKASCPDVWAEHGRGLFLVDSVCERFYAVDGGVCVQIKIK